MARYFFLFDIDETLVVGNPSGPISPLLLVQLGQKGHVVGVVACRYYVAISPISGQPRYIHRSETKVIGQLLGDAIPYYVDCDIDSLSDVLISLRLKEKCDDYFFISATMAKLRKAIESGWKPLHPNAAQLAIEKIIGKL